MTIPTPTPPIASHRDSDDRLDQVLARLDEVLACLDEAVRRQDETRAGHTGTHLPNTQDP